jgi:hypothetical protein
MRLPFPVAFSEPSLGVEDIKWLASKAAVGTGASALVESDSTRSRIRASYSFSYGNKK